MPKSKQPRKKKAAPEPVDVAKDLAEALAEKPQAKPSRHAEAPDAQVGDRVTINDSKVGSVYMVTGVSGDTVNLNIPGTNLERFRVPISNLTFVDKAPRPAAKPAKPAFYAEEIRERLDAVQHSNIDHLSGEIAILKKYLMSKRAPSDAIEDLEAFRKQQEEAWNAIVAKISELLEE
jgi:hypothetical protein